jgi:hypothetical protein
MPLRLVVEGAERELRVIKCEHEHALLGSPFFGQTIEITYPLRIICDDAPENFYMEILYKRDISENDIYQIYDRHDRIGWLFPINALESREHQFAENEHFLNYAYNAYKLLLEDADSRSTAVRCPNEEGEYFISEFYGEDAVILLLHKSRISKEIVYRHHIYLPSLLDYGFSYEKSDDSEDSSPNRLPDGVKITLNHLSINLFDEQYIELLYTKYLHHNRDNLLYRFIILYQVIELLMSRVADVKIGEIKSYILGGNSDFNIIKQKINDASNELKRINIIFSDQCQIESSQYNDLINTLNVLLAQLGDSEQRILSDAIYKLRNVLIHNYRMINDTHYELFLSIVNHFECLINDIVTKYIDITVISPTGSLVSDT